MTKMPFRWWIAVALMSYFLGVLLGILIQAVQPAIVAEQWASRLDSPAVALPGTTEIAVNNLRVVLILSLGILTGGLITVAVLFFNGILLGVTITLATSADKSAVLWTAVAPHAAPEITAFIISGAANIWFAAHSVAWSRGRPPPNLGLFARFWILPQGISIGLILIAAVIEGKFSHA